ncbi:hypothetical protein BX600DRAFT_157723 [Xylariales sp. PMI_506]|nr:hypothetical protein BX600DRAFT_157723 [Xylariales sp. PMI_506]
MAEKAGTRSAPSTGVSQTSQAPEMTGDELQRLLERQDWTSSDAYQALERLQKWAKNQQCQPFDPSDILMRIFREAIDKEAIPVVGALISAKGKDILQGFDKSQVGVWNTIDCFQIVNEFPETELSYISMVSGSEFNSLYDVPEKKLGEFLADSSLLDGAPANDATKMAAWIRIPSTNGIIATEVIKSVQKAIRRKTGDRLYLNIISKGFLPPPIKPSDSALNYREPSFKYISYGDGRVNRMPAAKLEYVSIVFPFLVLESKERHQDVKNGNLELRASVPSGGSNIHIDRTLHEAYYPGLDTNVLREQNDAQVVSRRPMPESDDDETLRTPILLVSQFWLWQIDNFVISACSKDEYSTLYRGIVNGEDDLVNSADADGWAFRCHDQPPDSFLGALLADKVIAFGRTQSDESPLVLDILETEIFALVADVSDYIASGTAGSNAERERDFVKRVAEFRSEFAIILDIFEQQKAILDQLLSRSKFYNPEKPALIRPLAKPREWAQHQVWDTVIRARCELDKYKQRVARMDREVERSGQSISDQLDLVRTYASLRDSSFALILSVAVAGLTIITVIFTPLAFITALFALPIDGLVRNQYQVVDAADHTDNVRAYRSGYIGTWFTVAEIVSLAVTAIVVLVSLWLGGVYPSRREWKPIARRWKVREKPTSQARRYPPGLPQQKAQKTPSGVSGPGSGNEEINTPIQILSSPVSGPTSPDMADSIARPLSTSEMERRFNLGPTEQLRGRRNEKQKDTKGEKQVKPSLLGRLSKRSLQRVPDPEA